MRLLRQLPAVFCFMTVLLGEVLAQSNGRERLLSTLPRYDANVRAARDAEKAKSFARPPPDDDVHVLPEFIVRDDKIPLTARDVKTRATKMKDAMRIYARDMNALELALNRWHIPFLSASFAERAYADQETKRLRSQFAGYAHIADVADRVDPGTGKAIREALQRQ